MNHPSFGLWGTKLIRYLSWIVLGMLGIGLLWVGLSFAVLLRPVEWSKVHPDFRTGNWALALGPSNPSVLLDVETGQLTKPTVVWQPDLIGAEPAYLLFSESEPEEMLEEWTWIDLSKYPQTRQAMLRETEWYHSHFYGGGNSLGLNFFQVTHAFLAAQSREPFFRTRIWIRDFCQKGWWILMKLAGRF